MTERAAKELARTVFADRCPLAERYAELLCTEGIVRGLLGPREADRIWSRHLLNSAGLASAVAEGSSVADVGSGAGLPGVPLALCRPDLRVTLIEPLLRRATFLDEVIVDLGLSGQVTVVRARAEDLMGEACRFDVVTSRAVAALDKLVRWCLPLMQAGGEIIAVKGSSAADEVVKHQRALERLRLTAEVQHLTAHSDLEPTTVVRLRSTV